MKNIEVVAGIIINDKNRIFCAQRNNYGEAALKWEFPGGKIELGETHEKALIRELNEELNITVVVNGFLMTTFHKYKTFNLKMHVYFCSIKDGIIKLNEHNEYQWLSKENLLNLDWTAADVPIVKELIKKFN